jgi:hypothetical protein
LGAALSLLITSPPGYLDSKERQPERWHQSEFCPESDQVPAAFSNSETATDCGRAKTGFAYVAVFAFQKAA